MLNLKKEAGTEGRDKVKVKTLKVRDEPTSRPTSPVSVMFPVRVWMVNMSDGLGGLWDWIL